MEDVLLCAAALLAEDERVAAEVRRQYQLVRGRRVPGRQPDPGRAARPVARRPRRPVRGRRPGADDLLLRRGQRGLPARLPQAVPGHHLDRAGPQLPLHAAGGRGGQPAAGRHRQRGACGCRSQQEAGAEVAYAEYPTRSPRPRRSRPTSSRCATRASRLREIAVLFRINAQSEAFEEALAARGVPYVVRGAARFFERPEVRKAVTLLRGNARGGVGSGDGVVADVTRGAGRHGVDRDRADRARQRARPLGVPAGDRHPGGGVRRRAGRAPSSARSSTTSTGAPPSSTPRSPRASRWPRCTPPRAWSGTRSSCAACTRARCRSCTPRARPPSRRSAGCCTSA